MTGSREVADVLIIGSGASGGALAWSLSRAPGIKIVCLEQGDWAPEPTFNPNAGADSETQQLTTPPLPDGVNYLADGYPYEHSDSIWKPSMYNGVRGGTVHYGGESARFHPSDFRVRTLDGVADDWPLSYRELEPYYDLNDRMMGVAGVGGNTSIPAATPPPLPPHKVGKAAQIFIKGFEKLGWHWWPADRAVVTEPYGDGRLPCDNRCLSCRQGCHRRAKGSTDVVYWPTAIRNGVVLKTRARVRQITVDPQGLAQGALYYDVEGRLQEQRARIVVVACNGIGTPRLLLNSQSSLFPDGLANSSGLVGKNLMNHIMANVVGLVEDADVYQNGLKGGSVISDQFYETDPGRGFVRGFQWLCGMGGSPGPLETALGSPSRSAGLGNGRAPRLDMLSWGQEHHKEFRGLFRHTLGATLIGDNLPRETNRVVLHPTLTDDTGIPAPRLEVSQGENSEKLISYAIEKSKELLEAAGATEIISVMRGAGAIGHCLGTARMGDNPDSAVVDKWCRSHDVRNLFIIDGSVFVTSGATQVTSTIGAIALRAADYINSNSRHLMD